MEEKRHSFSSVRAITQGRLLRSQLWDTVEGVVLHWIHVGFRALREVWWFALGTCALRGEGSLWTLLSPAVGGKEEGEFEIWMV